MKFTVIGHACLLVETQGRRILLDPWILGSCYWRSWWHYPPSVAVTDALLDVDYVLISHYHFDHMHYPSLRCISKKAQVLIPRFGTVQMVHELQKLGFAQIKEMPHGERVTLEPGLEVASFQYGFDDSALLLRSEGVFLADLNDCKIQGRTSQAILEQMGQPDFLFKSHSWAMAYPSCYEAEDAKELHLLEKQDYVESFLKALGEFKPKYAVPFASMVGFLHPESMHCNAFKVTPQDVKKEFDAQHIEEKLQTQLILMVPGDTWDSAAGFHLSAEDYYQDAKGRLLKMADAVSPKLDDAMEQEKRGVLRYENFCSHLGAFLRFLPMGLGRFVERPQIFYVPSSDKPYWAVDLKHRTISQSTDLPANWASVITIPEAVLADSLKNNILNFVHISMRIRIRLAKGGSKSIFRFWALLTIFELGYFPLRRLLTPRALGVWWRRRREFIDDYLLNFIRGKSVEDVRFSRKNKAS